MKGSEEVRMRTGGYRVSGMAASPSGFQDVCY